MTSVTEIDRLVVSDDAAAARIWPRLGPRVRTAYLNDRDGWIALRRKVEAGATLPPATLAAEHRVFTGWARALRAAGGQGGRTATAKQVRRKAGPATAAVAKTAATAPGPRGGATAAAPAAASPLTSRAALATPPLATAAQAKGSGGAAVAGGIVLAGLIAVAAARRKHA